MAANIRPRKPPPKKKPKARKVGQVPLHQQWAWLTEEMLLSPAWRELLRHKGAYGVVCRVMAEHLAQYRLKNGRLIVPYADFHDYGVARGHIIESIEIAEALGFLVVHHGRWTAADHQEPNRYGLTFFPIGDTFETNDWMEVRNRAHARAIVQEVKSRRAQVEALPRAPSITPEAADDEYVTGTD
jgi:hypothetical protein